VAHLRGVADLGRCPTDCLGEKPSIRERKFTNNGPQRIMWMLSRKSKALQGVEKVPFHLPSSFAD
jgi:hypothetical protein